MTTIGIIGSGHVGSNLAKAAIAHGYDVVLSNSKGPESLAGLVAELGPRARAATPAKAAAAGEFAITAIPVTIIGQVPAEPLAGKVVIATINYFPQRDGHIRELDDGARAFAGVSPRKPGRARVQHDRCGGHVRGRSSRGRSEAQGARACRRRRGGQAAGGRALQRVRVRRRGHWGPGRELAPGPGAAGVRRPAERWRAQGERRQGQAPLPRRQPALSGGYYEHWRLTQAVLSSPAPLAAR